MARAEGVVAVNAPRTVFAACDATFVKANPVPDQFALSIVTVEPSAPAVTPVAATAEAVAAVAAAMLVLQVTALEPPLVVHCKALADVEQEGMATAVGDPEPAVALTRTVLAV
jgi:hypothetical protein